MATREKRNHFIGRGQEIQLFKDWLQDPDAPWILYFHDSTEEQEKKGGIGKTWLLRACEGIARQVHPDSAILLVDFFNVEDRGRLFLAEKVVQELHHLCPEWHPTAFWHILEQYYSQKIEAALSKRVTDVAEDETTFKAIAAALVEDVQRLEEMLQTSQKMLLVVFDTFEVIEDNPIIAVLRHSQTFPDNYGSSHMKVLMAGRNRLDWNHPNWRGRQHEVRTASLHPFSKQEMLDYMEVEAIYNPPPQEQQQIDSLYKRTEGRPIMIGLVVDVLNNRIQSLEDLLASPESSFEQNLIPQINKLENPINWVILFMAHAYHHFNMALLERILHEVPQSEPLRSLSLDEIAEKLPQLSFVRKSSTGDSFVLHDEMRRLVVKYCWEGLDPDKRLRKEISHCAIDYYNQRLNDLTNEVWQQLCYLIILHHSFFVDLEEGLQYFKARFMLARRLRRRVFARLLFQEALSFSSDMSLAQYNDVQLREAQLLRLEDTTDNALHILELIQQRHDPLWYQENYYDVLNEQGQCYLTKNFWNDAERCLSECCSVELSRNNLPRAAFLLKLLGYIERRRGLFNRALDRYQESVALYKKLKERDYRMNYAEVLGNISSVYRYQGKTEEALLHCKFAWRLRRDLFREGKIDEVPIGWSLSLLAAIYLSAGNIAEAESSLNEAYDIYIRAGSKSDIAVAYHRFGQIQFERRNLDAAYVWFEKTRQVAVEANAEYYIMSLIWQGRIAMQQQRWTEAQALFEQTIQRAQHLSDNYQKVEGLLYLAECLYAQNQETRAQQLLVEAEQNAREHDYNELLGRIEYRRGDILYYRQEFRQAFQHFVGYCYYMALYNHAEYSVAVRRVIDALIGAPGEDTQPILDDITAFWESHHLSEEHPELIAACQEVKALL